MPNAVAIASETRGLRAALLVVVLGVFALGWFIRLDLFRFRFVHHWNGYFVFFHGPVPEVVLAAAVAAKGKLRGCFRIGRLLANGASQFHAKAPDMNFLRELAAISGLISPSGFSRI